MTDRELALNLRLKGYTYPEIEIELGIVRSTLSGWFKSFPLPKSTIKLLLQKAKVRNVLVRKRAVEANRIKYAKLRKELEEEALISIKKDLIHVGMKDFKLALAMLYLGEGGKTQDTLKFGNSDPEIIKLFVVLLKKAYRVKEEQLKCHICYRYDQDLKTLSRYWSKITGIPLKNFYNTKPDPRTEGKPTLKIDYKGVCSINWTSGEGRRALYELKSAVKIFNEHLGM